MEISSINHFKHTLTVLAYPKHYTCTVLTQILSSNEHTHITRVAKASGRAAVMLSHAIEHTKIHLTEAIQLYEV